MIFRSALNEEGAVDCCGGPGLRLGELLAKNGCDAALLLQAGMTR